MNGGVFVDAGVLVACWDRGSPERQRAASAWEAALWRSRRGRVSAMVLDELFLTLTGLEPGLPVAEARAQVRDYWRWRPVVQSLELVERTWSLQARYAMGHRDAQVAAAAILGRCDHVLSDAYDDGQDLFGVKVVDPYRRGPDVLGL